MRLMGDASSLKGSATVRDFMMIVPYAALEIPEEITEAFIDGIWYTIARNRMAYNAEGKRIRSENLAGQVTTTAWDCCLAYGYNEKSELTNAVASVDSNYRYAYDFDDIGAR